MIKKIEKISHTIKFSVFSKSFPTTVEILVNGDREFVKDFPAGKKVIEKVVFEKDYEDQKENNIKFVWKPLGGKEDGEKDLRVDQIMIHRQFVDEHNYEYHPDLNDDWWNHLSEEERNKYLRVIHGSPSKNFGWHGEIDYNFVTLIDFRSKQLYNTRNNNIRLLVGQSTNWIYYDRSCINPKKRLYRRKHI